jgi:hypothetical protein
MRNALGVAVGQFHVQPNVLREIAEALNSLAAELGVSP